MYVFLLLTKKSSRWLINSILKHNTGFILESNKTEICGFPQPEHCWPRTGNLQINLRLKDLWFCVIDPHNTAASLKGDSRGRGLITCRTWSKGRLLLVRHHLKFARPLFRWRVNLIQSCPTVFNFSPHKRRLFASVKTSVGYRIFDFFCFLCEAAERWKSINIGLGYAKLTLAWLGPCSHPDAAWPTVKVGL